MAPGRSAVWRVVALVALVELPVLFEMRKDAVEIVRLDLHTLRQLRDRNPGLLVHMRQHLLRPTTSAARTPRTPGRSTPLGSSRTLRCASRCPHCSLSHTLQRIKRFTNLRVLRDQRLKLTQPLL